jgi:hypothetical protein
MANTLRRPMFRIGGSAGTGITSGLAPRQGYQGDGMSQLVKQFPEYRRIAKEESYQPRGSSLNDFLIDFGLNLAGSPSQGNIFQTAAATAQEPYQRMMKGRRESEQMQYASESDLFKTLVGAGAKIQAAEADAAAGADTYMYKEKAKDIKSNIEEQLELRDEFQGLDMNNETDIARAAEIKDELRTLKSVYTDPEFSKAMLKWVSSKQQQRWLSKMIIKAVEKELNMIQDMNNPTFFNKYNELMTEILGDFAIGIPPTFEKGGRVGYQGGGAEGVVSTGGYDTTGRPAYDMEGGFQPSNIPGMPEELSNISYEELRSRLPQEVSDEVVRLLANSAEALEDFATIQTEQDIANFNKKYGVNLVLPSEG